MNCRLNGIPGSLFVEQPVSIMDRTTKPVDAFFARSLSTFLVKADTGASGIDEPSLIYDFSATGPGPHGISPGDEILLLDVVASREFFAVVLAVVVDTITVDRPIDHDFPLGALGRIVSTQMNVDGSVTPVIFSVRAGTIPTDITRLMIGITDNLAMDSSKFGGIAALTKGLVFRVLNSYQKTVFNFKSNGQIKNYSFDAEYDDKAGAGLFGFYSRISFGGDDKHGVVLRISGTDVLQWVVQDDLTALSSLNVTAQGHDTESPPMP